MTLRRAPHLLASMLALAVWAALPWVEWCSTSWQDCSERCSAAAVAACAEEAPCAQRMAAAEAASECGAASAYASAPSDPIAPGAPEREDSRAWCLHAPFAGLGSRGADVAPPAEHALLAVLVEPSGDLDRPAAAIRQALERVAPHPALRDPHAPPLGRAPPRA